jgi:putative ABC transport system permease protein
MMRGNTTVSGDDTEKSLSLMGVFPEFFSLSNLEVEVGNIFLKEDIQRRNKVVILGSAAAEDLFEDYTPEEIRGETVNIAGKKFEVVAVLKSNGQSTGSMSMDDAVFVPYSTADKNILGEKGMTILMFHAKSVEDLGVAQLEVEALLRKNHNLRSSDDSDFRVRDPGSIVSSAQATSKTLTFLLTAVASIVLFVSGIGIMNVMFVTVAERTKEIGILKAIGAKQKDILLQFLMEAVILSLVGGLIGIVLGGAIIPLLKSYEAVYSLFSVFIGFSFSALVGIFFGFYPALKASKLDPVDALRSE